MQAEITYRLFFVSGLCATPPGQYIQTFFSPTSYVFHHISKKCPDKKWHITVVTPLARQHSLQCHPGSEPLCRLQCNVENKLVEGLLERISQSKMFLSVFFPTFLQVFLFFHFVPPLYIFHVTEPHKGR